MKTKEVTETQFLFQIFFFLIMLYLSDPVQNANL
jgi:hypothetical protein